MDRRRKFKNSVIRQMNADTKRGRWPVADMDVLRSALAEIGETIWSFARKHGLDRSGTLYRYLHGYQRWDVDVLECLLDFVGIDEDEIFKDGPPAVIDITLPGHATEEIWETWHKGGWRGRAS